MKYIIKYYLRDANSEYKTGYVTKKSETDLTVKDIKDFLKTELKIDENYTVDKELLEVTSHEVEIVDSTVLSGKPFENLEYNIQVLKKK